MKIAIQLCMLVAGAAASEYPATYPYENEGDISLPPAPSSATPSFTYDDSDPGGYHIRNLECDLNDFVEGGVGWEGVDKQSDPAGFPGFTWPNACQSSAYYYHHAFAVPPILPNQIYNCTGRPMYEPLTDSYQLDGESRSTESCAYLDGFPRYEPGIETSFEAYSERLTGGLCGPVDDVVICQIYSLYQYMCLYQYLSPGDRAHVGPCWNNMYAWYMTCTLYTSAGSPFNDLYEPPAYLQSLTPAQSLTLVPIFEFPDRVCLPYTYYYPNTAADAGSDTETGDASLAASLFSVALTAWVIIALSF